MSDKPRKRPADEGAGTPSKKQKTEALEPDASGKLSFREAAVEILRRHQKPLTAKEISDIMLNDNMVETTGKTPDRTLAAQMYTEINKKGGTSLFCKAGPGLFALREFWTGGDDGAEGATGAETPERKTTKRTPKKAKPPTPKASTSISNRRDQQDDKSAISVKKRMLSKKAEEQRPPAQHAAQRSFNPNECALCHHEHDKNSLVRHPIVGNLKVMFCNPCADDIMKKRRLAQEKGYLQFPGEPNEEICKLCSKGTPELPIHLNCCDVCESAYCNDCVSTIFGNDEFRRMSEKEHWSCPLCRRKQKKAREALRAAASQPGGAPSADSPSMAASTTTPPQSMTANASASARNDIDEADANGELEINTAESMAPKANPGSPSALAATLTPAAKEGRGTHSTNNNHNNYNNTNDENESKIEEHSKSKLVDNQGSHRLDGNRNSQLKTQNNNGNSYAYLYLRYFLDLSNKLKTPGPEDDCFVCKNGGDVLICCDYPGCTKVYHKDCLHLDCLPEKGNWICPQHSCCECRKNPPAAETVEGSISSTVDANKASHLEITPAVHQCVTCPNAYCDAHKPAKDKVKMLRDNKMICPDCTPYVKMDMLAELEY